MATWSPDPVTYAKVRSTIQRESHREMHKFFRHLLLPNADYNWPGMTVQDLADAMAVALIAAGQETKAGLGYIEALIDALQTKLDSKLPE